MPLEIIGLAPLTTFSITIGAVGVLHLLFFHVTDKQLWKVMFQKRVI